MPEGIVDMVRSRIEAIRGQQAGGQGILEPVRERISAIREKGLAGVRGGGLLAQGGIVERVGERFPALKRVRGQLEPFERPALFERGLTGVRKELQRETAHKEMARTEVEFKPPEAPRIF